MFKFKKTMNKEEQIKRTKKLKKKRKENACIFSLYFLSQDCFKMEVCIKAAQSVALYKES